MMNKFQDLMGASAQVEIVVDAAVSEGHLKVVRGTIVHVGRNYIEVLRVATPDEKSRYNTDKLRVVVPVDKIIEVVYVHSD